MPRKFRKEANSGKTILLVDDDRGYLEATRLILEREGHRVIVCDNGRAALSHVRSTNVDLLLLDYLMPGMSCEETLSELRVCSPYLGVILQTGYASEHPSRELLRRLDVQGCYDKSDGPENLLLWVDVGLKASEAVTRMAKSSLGLEYVLSSAADLHKIQPMDDLLRGVLLRVSDLLGSSKTFLSVTPPPVSDAPIESFLAMAEGEGDELRVRSGLGRFNPRLGEFSEIPPGISGKTEAALRRGELVAESDHTVVPLRAGDVFIGIIYLDSPLAQDSDGALLMAFADQAAVAIQNAQLYELATVDTLTGAFVRRFFFQWFERELKNARRSRKPLGFIVIELDGMKETRDGFGRVAANRALAEAGAALRESMRISDCVGRCGVDSFYAVLPDCDEEGLSIVADRLMRNVRSRSVSGPNGPVALSVSAGHAVLQPQDPDIDPDYGAYPGYFESLAFHVQQAADASLSVAKSFGRGRIGPTNVIAWPDPKGTPRLDGALSLE